MVPVALKTFSTWWPEGASLIKSIGETIQDQTEEKPSMFFLIQSTSMAFLSGNAASILGTIKPSKKLDRLFFMTLTLLVSYYILT